MHYKTAHALVAMLNGRARRKQSKEADTMEGQEPEVGV